MANKRIKGITIEIGGNTQNLTDALKNVDKQIYNLNGEIKDLDKALKFDPKNTELLAQKQELLEKNIKASKDRLNELKEAQRQMGDYNSLTEEGKEKYRALSVEISKSEAALRDMNNELKKTTSIDTEKLKNGLKKVGDVAWDVSKKLAEVSVAIGGALASVVGLGVKSYAELEQNLGGIETLFGDSADKVVENAQKAFKTAGVSANEYMQGVTSFSASLLQSLGGNTNKAADVADMAFKDMADNANKFGTDMGSIQSAYQGFAKQNYTMLDNLKLGYGGTKTEMQRLLKDAEKFSGVKYDINNLSDVYNAIHVIQEELGVTGTTAKEASETISGSTASMKAAFDNFINGSGGADDLIESVNNVLTNVMNAVMEIAPDILSGIPKLISNILPTLVTSILSMVNPLLNAVTDMIKSVLTMVIENKESLVTTVVTIINDIVSFITENLPTIIEAGITILLALVEGIIESLPNIIESTMTLLDTIINTIIDNLDEIIELAIDLVVTLAIGIIDALPKLIKMIPTIIVKIVEALTKPEMLLKLIKAALTLILELGKGLIEAIPELLKLAPRLIKELVESFKTTIKETDWGKLGTDMVKGILDGLVNIGNYLSNKVNEVKDKVTEKFKKVFGIASPSKLFKKEIGTNLALGISEGFVDEMGKVTGEMTNAIPMDQLIYDYKSALSSLTHGINASVNPTINPKITYEQNYAMMSKAMKDALNDMVVDLDDREVGRFVSKTITQEVYGR